MTTVDLTDMELMAPVAAHASLIDDVHVDQPRYQSLLIRQIRRDGGTQARVGLNEDVVTEYTELMRDHLWDFQSRQRPIVLYDGDAFWLADGFHRIEAAQRAQLSDFPVEVLNGNQRDAVLRAAGANSQHGLRRTNADKRRAVELLLKDVEWRQWSDRKIADTCAVDHKTVADVRKALSGEIPQIETRIVERNGSTYQMTPAAPKPSAINRPDGSPAHYQPLPAPIALPIPTNDAADTAALQTSIRELAEPLGLQMIWEDDRVLLYWPDEADDIEQMDLLSYGAALEWLTWEAVGIKKDRETDENAPISTAPAQADPAHVERLEAQIESDRIPEAGMISLSALDSSLPKALQDAGYFWKSAQPIVIAHIDGWTGDAPTVDLALQSARDRMTAKGEPIVVFPALNEQECKALIREAKQFIERGLAREYPTFGKALRIAARMALEATD